MNSDMLKYSKVFAQNYKSLIFQIRFSMGGSVISTLQHIKWHQISGIWWRATGCTLGGCIHRYNRFLYGAMHTPKSAQYAVINSK